MSNLSELPKLFEEGDGRVSVDLLRHLFSTCRSPSKTIREILGAYGIKLGPKEDVFSKLSEFIPLPEFRTAWYAKNGHRRLDRAPTLFFMANIFLENKYKNLRIDSPELISFFERRNVKGTIKTFPILKKIDILIEQIDTVSASSKFDAALYAWSLIERIKWAAIDMPNEQSLSNFEATFFQAISHERHEELRLLLTIPAWKKIESADEALVNNLRPAAKTAEKKDQLVAKEFVESPHWFEVNLLGMQPKLAELIQLYTAQLGIFNLSAEELRIGSPPGSALGDLESTVQAMRSLWTSIEQRSTEISDYFSHETKKALAKIKWEFDGELDVLKSTINYPDWLNLLKKKIKDIIPIFTTLDSLNKKANGEVEVILEKLTRRTVSLGDLEQSALNLREELLLIDTGLLSRSKIQAEIIANFSNFSWNPLTSSSLSSQIWCDYGKLLIHDGDFSRMLGIVLRKEFFSLHRDFLDSLIDAIGEKKINLRSAFHVLRCLSLGQIEKFEISDRSVKSVFAVCELHAYFELAESDADAFVYWSASPLNYYAIQPATDAFSKFIQFLFYRCEENSNRKLGLAQLKKNILRAKAELDPSGVDSPREALLAQLDDVLRVYRRGGNTYAELWSQAYTTLFAPLKLKADQQQFDEVLIGIDLLNDAFQIEHHLDTWKTAIPEHLRKRSEYDKQIRSQVTSKIIELVSWANSYRDVLSAESEDIDFDAELVRIIRDVYDSDDSNSVLLKEWFSILVSTHEDDRSIPWCSAREVDSCLQLGAASLTRSALKPRSNRLSNPTFGDVFGDEVIGCFVQDLVPMLGRAYAEQRLYESYFALSSISEDLLPPDLDRRVEEEVDALLEQQQGRIQGIKESYLKLGFEDTGILEYLSEVERLLSEQQWEKLSSDLDELEKYVQRLQREKGEEEKRKQLITLVAKLGGDAPTNSSLDSLEKIYAQLLLSLAPRRRHIEVVKTLTHLNRYTPEIAHAANLVVHDLEEKFTFPNASQSEYLAYVLEQAINPLAEELKRRRTQLQSYSEKISTLALTLLAHIPDADFIFNGSSRLLNFLEGTSEKWKELPNLGESGLDELVGQFELHQLSLAIPHIAQKIAVTPDLNAPYESTAISQSINDNSVYGDAAVSRLIEKVKPLLAKAKAKANRKHLFKEFSLATALDERNWEEVMLSAADSYYASGHDLDSRSSDMLTNWIVAAFRWNDESFVDEDFATLFYLVNRSPNALCVRAIMPTKNSKGIVHELVSKLLLKMSNEMNFDSSRSPIENLLLQTKNSSLSIRLRSILEMAFSSPGGAEPLMLRTLWDSFSGDPKQAEVRADLMTIFWQNRLPNALATCLTYGPIDIPRRQAYALASIADQALVARKFDLLQSFHDLRKTIIAKPFQLFVNAMLIQDTVQEASAAKFEIVGPLERTDGLNVRGILRIIPRKYDCPDTIVLSLSELAPLRFDKHALEKTFIGPFIEETRLSVLFELVDEKASVFTIDVNCSVISITGKTSQYSTDLRIDLAHSAAFQAHTPEELDEAFLGFPEFQMRGDEYVPRREDERKIEKSLFASKTVRSLWISSPRRSGKTTMLYKILDSYSHKIGRDNVVVYLTLDQSFTGSENFNRWIWKRLRSTTANSELRDLYVNIDEMGVGLPWSSDTGTFISALSDQLLHATLKTQVRPTRVIFLIDEIDKLASMYFTGGEKRETAMEIMWQIRQVIAERRDIGFVFAGSSAAKRIFVSNSDAPFFNGIHLLELTPFSCRNSLEEAGAREIVEPTRLRKIHTISKESLEHLIWVCAGIPYYMKLVAGATYAIAKQSHVLISDINEGLRALLSKSTGISKLDDMSGDPGSDELRTMAIEGGSEKVLTLAVLYSVAEAHSPLSGHKLFRAHITSKDSPMVSRYRLSKKMIDRGLDLSIELGLLEISSDKIPEIDFAIPILGESIRHAGGRLWAGIDHELEEMGNKGAVTND